MTKKILTILAATLMVSGAWAETIDNNQGVVYTLGASSSNETLVSSTTNVSNITTTNYASGRLDLKITTTSNYNITNNQVISINSFNSSYVTISSWSNRGQATSDPSNGEGSENIINKDNSDWNTYKNYAINFSNTDNILSWTEVKSVAPTLSNVKVKSKADGEMSWGEWNDPNYESYNENFIYYKLTETLTGRGGATTTYNTFYAIHMIAYVPVQNRFNTVTTNYNITSIPTGLSWTSVNNVTIGSSITSIADGAFVGASNIEAYNASGTYTSDVNKCLKKGSVLVMAPNTFSNSTKTLPASTYTSINANAFNNVHDAVVYLNGNVASYSGGTNNTFIGNTLTSGSVKNSMLVGGGYTIPSTISTINEGAFKDATELTSVSCNNVSDRWTFTNGILYNKDKTTVLLVTASAGNNIILPNSVTRIADYALANVTGVTVNSSNSSLTWGSNQGGNTINKPSTTLKYTSANDGKTYDAGQILTNSNLASAISGFTGSYLDFSNCSVFETINLSSISLADNVILYLPAGTVTSGLHDNVIVGNTCANLVIKDKVNRTFHAPKAFTASNVSYNRSIGTGWSMVVLPFDVPNTKANQFDYFKLTNYNTETNTFTFGVQSQLLANTAYLLKSKSGNITFSTTNANVQVTEPNTSYGMNGAIFHGTFSQFVTPAISSGTDFYYGLSGGKLMRFDGVTISAFRAYLTAPKANYHDAPEFRFEDEDGFELNEEGFANSIEYVDADQKTDDVMYNLNGVQVSNLKKSGVYVSKNNKIIIK